MEGSDNESLSTSPESLSTSPESDSDVLKVVVVGEKQVGKTSFIRAYYDHHEPETVESREGVDTYRCRFTANYAQGTTEIYEIPGVRSFPKERRTPYYRAAHGICVMYAIDDPWSFQEVKDKWLPEISEAIIDKKVKNVLVVGNKMDLRDEPQTIEALGIVGEAPVTPQQADELLRSRNDFLSVFELSTSDLPKVNEPFGILFNFATG